MERESFFPLRPHKYDLCIGTENKRLSHEIYTQMAEGAMLLHSKYVKWLADCGQTFVEGLYQFGLLHTDIYRCTNIAKFRSFQYRVLQRALVTNIQLYKWQIVASELCTFCRREPETIIHLLYYCPEIKKLWEQIFIYIKERFNVSKLEISAATVINNKLIKGNPSAVNFVCLVVKQYIYRQRCQKKDICIYELKSYIRKIESIEKYIAVKNGKLNKHLKKWSVVDENDVSINNINTFVQQYTIENVCW